MKCPNCQKTTSHVIDSRISKEGDTIRRRRECDACENRFTTYERVEYQLPLVIKKDGSRVNFDRQKILSGIQKACEKRPVTMDAMEGIVSRVEQEILKLGEHEIESTLIGERLMAELQKLDQVAYVRFASVYREFKGINEFMAELKGLLGKKQ